ncbi:signal recognition particle protein [Candidatus Poribacteria bacterium]|nr:signal recognition particle protein [Candidatus Poribacteria bacterium]
MFESLGEKFEGVFRMIRGQKTLTEDNMQEALRQVRMALLEADVNYLVVKDFVGRVREQALGQDVIKGVNPAQQLVSIVHNELVRMMDGGEGDVRPFAVQPGKRTVILMLGLQGAGKTTFCGKLARRMADERCKPLLVACDIYRPAAIEQLKQVGAALDIPVFEMGTGHAPADIIAAAQKEAERTGRDLLIVDTAGRLHIDEVRMDELRAIRDRIKPDYTFLVADAMTGQDAVQSAQTFDDQVGIDGVCLTKLDGDARGGAALSIRAVTGKPIVFVGVGEKAADLEQFHPDRVAQRILGMGDVVSLVEKAQKAIDENEAMEIQEKLGTGQFTYTDFIKQMKMIKRMGPLKGLLGMLPGVGSMLRGLDGDMLNVEMKRVEAIILSMTPSERDTPDLVKTEGKRRDRIAKGSGHTLKQVNDLVKQFEQMRGMMQQLAGGGLFDKMKGLMANGEGEGGPGPMMGPGDMPPPGAGGMPVMPGMPGYKRYQQYMKGQERPQGPSHMPKKKRIKKKKRSRN